MIIYNLVGTENHNVYQQLSAENLSRQYSFLRSITLASLQLQQQMLSIEVLKALNYHGISCLHSTAGEFRPCPVKVGDGDGAYLPPPAHEVPSRMQMFTNEVNRHWEAWDPVSLASFVLWKLNYIHPFINGNGRTARAACHFIICLKLGGWLPGEPILPELIRQNRDTYVERLKAVDASAAAGTFDISPLAELIAGLLEQQIASAGHGPANAPPPPPIEGAAPEA